jgi:hypothetical protein
MAQGAKNVEKAVSQRLIIPIRYFPRISSSFRLASSVLVPLPQIPFFPPSTKSSPINWLASPVKLECCLNLVLPSPISSRVNLCSPVNTPRMWPLQDTSFSGTTVITFGWNSMPRPPGGGYDQRSGIARLRNSAAKISLPED